MLASRSLENNMLASRRRRRLYIATTQLAAVLIGVTGAFAAVDRLDASPASASHNCTHYSPPYYTGPSTAYSACYAHQNLPPTTFMTDALAIRDGNAVNFRDGAYHWWLYYRDSNDNNYNIAIGTSQQGTIGSSGGYAKAACYIGWDSSYKFAYCTTLW